MAPIVLPDRSGCPRESCRHRARPAPGDADSGPRTSLQRLEPPDSTEVYQASGQGFGEGQVVKVDAAQNKLSVREADSKVHEFQASKETLQEFKVGDRIEANLREAPKCP